MFGNSGVSDTRQIFEDLVATVSSGMAAGLPLTELRDTVLLKEYGDWENYERLLPHNIEAAYNNLTLYR